MLPGASGLKQETTALKFSESVDLGKTMGASDPNQETHNQPVFRVAVEKSNQSHAIMVLVGQGNGSL